MIFKSIRVPFTQLLIRYNRSNFFLFWGGSMKLALTCDPIHDADRYFMEWIGKPQPRVFFGWRVCSWYEKQKGDQ